MTISALIADDEPPMRAQLRARLAEAWPELRIAAEASNGVEAVALAGQYRPDIVFLDVKMPGLGGIEAARSLYRQCHIVFVTAYDEYAVAAFEHGALDYLLKPVAPARLATTCARLQGRLQARLQAGDAAPALPADIGRQLEQLAGLVRHRGDARPTYLRWIQAVVGDRLRLISTREVLFFQAEDKYTRVQTTQGEVLIRKPLKELAEELDPAEFWRIHRSTLVRVDAIAEVRRDARGRQMLSLRHGGSQLEVSRGHGHLFQQM